ncbi:peptidase [Antarcticibacterium flavum]|uniref:Peptidase n=1 Tax=Antarcticibacterium flavum TaxID=2058175 RepID=A0A5B7X2R6_9FLAO|nr:MULTISPECIES: M14 family metallopeptidase [Antarcticibacterium]MCM4160147.1 peptidase [Antarcticibacterium sp. W02-3]QCY69697.1 peptidase [Antarcticibacterium flavum]
MKNKFLCLLAAISLGAFPAAAQEDYPTNREVTQRLQQIASSKDAQLISLTKTEGGQDIWALQLGRGDLENKPAIAITGGVEGYHVLSVELALQVAQRLLREHSELLDTNTFYVFPNMSPDAYSQYHSNFKYERRGNAAVVDNDRDGEKREDGYEDLNKDGYITDMRIESATGNYVAHKDYPQLLVKAEGNRNGEKRFLKYSEGIDNDKDGDFNEDPAEGIAFNKSLTYQFPAFEAYAGEFPVSQKESRALLDYLFERWNIFAFVTFAPENNLSSPLKYNKSGAEKRVVSSMLEKDVELNRMVSEIYNETISQKAYNQDNQGRGGDFFQWAYFHFGRLSFSTPGWWVPEVKAKEDSTQIKNGKLTPETNFLNWAEHEGINDVFIPWTTVSHPDFPNQNVEVGGIKPFLMTNPPYSMVDSIAINHTNFVVKLAEMKPAIEFHNVKTEKLSGGLTRITLDVLNNSPLPTHSEIGERSRWLQKLQITVNKDKKDILAGNTIKLSEKLGAYEKETVSWIVRGSGTLEVRAGAPHTGYATMNVKL